MDDLFQISFWLPQQWPVGTYTLHTFDCFIECSRRLYVRNNRERELVTVVAMALLYLIRGALASNGSSHIIPTAKEGIENMGCDKARPSRDENGLPMADMLDPV
jgi:hypothetical protein